MKNSKVSHMMSRSLSYIKDQYPIRLLSEIFRNYTKSLYRFRKGISLIRRNPSTSRICGISQSSVQTEDNLLAESTGPSARRISNSKDSVKITWSNRKFEKTASDSSVSLPRESSEDIKEKLNDKPSRRTNRLARTTKSALKREYPWQNFNIDVQKHFKHHRVKLVNNKKLDFKKEHKFSKPIVPIFCPNEKSSNEFIDSNHSLNGNVLMEDIKDKNSLIELDTESEIHLEELEQTKNNLGTSNSEELSIGTDEIDEIISESTPNLMVKP